MIRDVFMTESRPRRHPARSPVDRMQAEVRRLRAELVREQAGARCLRSALETAATFFDAPSGDPAGNAAWREICSAIRSDAGRS